MEETENILCGKNTTHITGEIALPLMKSVLLMPSPLIKINTNCADEKSDLHKLLQFTPGEGKSYYYVLRNVSSCFTSTFVIALVNMLYVICSSA